MNPLVSVLEVSGWDKLTAIGTFVGAIATAVAVVTALILGAKDRRAAQQALEEQLAFQRAERQREHNVDLLLRLQEQIAEADRNGAALNLGESLLLALPDASDLVATRYLFANANPEFKSMPRFSDKYIGVEPRSNPHLVDLYAKQEVADAIREITNR